MFSSRDSTRDKKKRSRLFADPRENEGRLVKAKPIDTKLARRLGDQHRGKDFVAATDSYADFAAGYEVIGDDGDDQSNSSTAAGTSAAPPMTTDELNKINAKILKAEMMGDVETIKKLKAQIEQSASSSSGAGKERDQRDEVSKKKHHHRHRDHEASGSSDVLLTRTDVRTGLTMPVKAKQRNDDEDDRETTKKRKMKVDMDRGANLTLKEMLEEERETTAEDQLAMFGAMSAKAAVSQKLDDDTTVDDIFISKKQSAKAEAKEKANTQARAIADHKRYEETLGNCHYCVDSRRLQKQLIVATGLKTYLCVPADQSLVENHCCIVPMMHVASQLQLDEDVYDEMKIWRKGLTAMFADSEEDCIFVETAKNVSHQRHMSIECVPVPKEVGETAPIYFKKAILECDEEWAQNKRVIDLSQKGIRRSIPKGFSYFAVDFGLQPGFAHVIENESLFPVNFAREIIGGILDLPHHLWRKIRKDSFEEQVKKAQRLKDIWKPYDWTEKVKEAMRKNVD